MRTKLLAATTLICILLSTPTAGIACGPFTMDVVFSLRTHPDLPLTQYMSGQAGIVPNSYGTMSLVLFYRRINGSPLSPAEQKQAENAIENKIFYRGGTADPNDTNGVPSKTNASAEWTAARGKLVTDKKEVTAEKEFGYLYYSNCLPDAFRNATRTLDDRLKKYGPDLTKEWLAGQDAVFSGCDDESAALPAEVPNAPAWLKQDRAYQIAAALFYRGKLPEARAAFQKVAADNTSTWQKPARFVAARTYTREASLIPTPEDGKLDAQAEALRQAALAKAASAFEAIIKDGSMDEFHPSAKRMLALVKYRATPAERRKELGAVLTSAAGNDNFYNDLTDYAMILRHITDGASDAGQAREQKEAEAAGKEYDYNYDLKLRDIPASERQDPLTDWILTYQAVDGGPHAIEKWRETNQLHWLAASISKAGGRSSEAAELISAGDKVPPSSPAFATVRFHQVRLLIEGGKTAEAKRKFDELGALGSFPVSTQNSFLAQRAVFAASLDDYLKYAQRKPAIFSWSEGDREEPADIGEDSGLKAWKDRTMFDADAAAFFNEKVPLSVMKLAAVNEDLPPHLRKILISAVWMRAFVLKNAAVEKEFAPLMARSSSMPLFEKYSAAVNPVEREAASLIAILRNPVVQPYIESGYGREDSSPTEIDSIRGNWWCVEDHADKTGIAFPGFLTDAQIAQAKREKDQIAAGGESATYLTRRALDFAARNPRNAQTPEILHLAVRSTRYGCTDANTGKFSKQAFDLLHSQYRTTPWAKNTPYWFGKQ